MFLPIGLKSRNHIKRRLIHFICVVHWKRTPSLCYQQKSNGKLKKSIKSSNLNRIFVFLMCHFMIYYVTLWSKESCYGKESGVKWIIFYKKKYRRRCLNINYNLILKVLNKQTDLITILSLKYFSKSFLEYNVEKCTDM